MPDCLHTHVLTASVRQQPHGLGLSLFPGHKLSWLSVRVPYGGLAIHYGDLAIHCIE